MLKHCQNCKGEFEITQDDEAFYRKIDVPAPTFCPECREIRRIAFRNERALYKRKCDSCMDVVVSRVSPDKLYPMYCKKCWWSDHWDGTKYGMEYDFSRPFFEQFSNLLNSVPHISIFNSNTVNSDWVNQETDDKNCYLNVGGHYNEDSAYNTYELYGKNSLDNFWFLNSEFGYENIYCKRCYKIVGSQDCYDCQDTFFSYDCRNCSNIFGCAGLRNKKYCIFNKQCTKEEYESFLKENPMGSATSYGAQKEKAHSLWRTVPRRFAAINKSVDVSGDNIDESKNSHYCFAAEKVEDAKHVYIGGWIRDSHDLTSHGAAELVYECSSGGGEYDAKFVTYCMSGDPLRQMHSSHLTYCFGLITSDYCFGCVGLRNKKYCILNKQYTKEEYDALVPKIIQHMNEMPYAGKNGRMYRYGEFFPIELSPFGYNETAAIDYYPLTREQAIERGYPWCDYESDTKYELSDYRVPDDLMDVGDDILKKTLKCDVSGKPYRIIPMELQFYRTMGLPVPRKAPLERHKERMARLLPRKLFTRECGCAGKTSSNGKYANTGKHSHGEVKCGAIMETSYSPERPEIVYCEQCYQAEIY